MTPRSSRMGAEPGFPDSRYDRHPNGARAHIRAAAGSVALKSHAVGDQGVGKAGRLNRPLLELPGGQAGRLAWVPVQVATASLGVSRQTVLQRVKRGDPAGNTAISLLRLSGATSIAAALRHHAARTERPITLLLTS